MWQVLETLRNREALSDVDLELARFLAEHDPAPVSPNQKDNGAARSGDPGSVSPDQKDYGAARSGDAEAGWPVVLGACLASRAPQQGDTCVDLVAQAGRPVIEEDEPVAVAPELDAWRDALRASKVVGDPGDFCPLILEDDRLYLQRYWGYEAAIAEDLVQRGTQTVDGVDTATLQAALARLFPEAGEAETDWQKVAAAVAVLRRLTLITGGPGTGKTTTVTRLLAALLEQPATDQLRIALAAPTGKAAARMQEAVRHAKAELPLDEALRNRIPEEARTLHRLLGARMSSTQFRHNRDNPLPFDVVVVDEASMVDVALFAKLLDAIPPKARLVIVGDRDQLAPVEAGSVLGEIAAGDNGFSKAFGDQLGEIVASELPVADSPSPLVDNLVALQRTHRFGDEGGLGHLVRAVKAGDTGAAKAVLTDTAYPDVTAQALPEEREGWEALVQELASNFEPLIEAGGTGDPARAFEAYRGFGVLDAMRQGPFGSEALNRQIEQALRIRGTIPAAGHWYPGKPVLVTQNDYRLKLFNGDVGIALPNNGELKVHFETPDGGYRALTPNRLPAYEPAYVLTVHKSQGSEVDEVAMLVPEGAASVNSRELVYTGISRARRGLTLRSPEGTLQRAITAPLAMASGLAAKLAAP
ncbi:exodeoxyribonuclease V subunit alpha [Thiohalorhabdus sp.]|uniref:exodeoxyribonuclease V subunit alpha n=1 Tax=Thiohalorhabdus sp. TaxID=3094134 RepID=UPI002FC355AA